MNFRLNSLSFLEQYNFLKIYVYSLIYQFFLVAPKIDRRNLKNIVIKEGEPFMFDVKVQGEPPPEISWNLNNKEIHSNSIKQIDNEPNHTKFYHKNPERKDSGIYKIHAVNKYGSDTAEVEVTVVCKYQHC